MGTLLRLRDLGNSVLVVEHDEDTMRAADWIIDMGPKAGEGGGRIVASGSPEDIISNTQSITGAYLSGRKSIEVPRHRRQGGNRTLGLRGARAHNLRNLTVNFPLGVLTCVTGVSGSGKSSLVVDTLLPALKHKLVGSKKPSSEEFDGLEGLQHVDKVIDIDQAPIGRTPRSNPATYTGVFTHIRDLFANLPESKARGYKPGRYSFNVRGGRCETCQGDGILRIEMHFLPDVYVECEACDGRRYNRETLEVKYRQASIADVLDMTVTQAASFLENIPKLRQKLETIREVGLGYIRLGQSATTLSGGEAQRIKLSQGAGQEVHRAHGLRAGRTDHRPALRRHRAAAGGAEPPGRGGQHRHRHRAQPGRHQDRRLGHRPGPRGRPGRRPGRRPGHPRGRGQGGGQPHRPVPEEGAVAAAQRVKVFFTRSDRRK